MEIINPYRPINWAAKFHRDPWKISACVGGKGSGKSRAAVEELVANSLEFPGSKYIIGRKTLQSLLDSTWDQFERILDPRLVAHETKKPLNKTLINGSQFLGRPLDEIKKFDSIEIAGYFVDEAEEISEEMFNTLNDRIRQKIESEDGRILFPRYRGILGLNPTEEDHWIPEHFLSETCPKDHMLYFSSTFDNQDNLPPGYIDGLMGQYTEEMQKRMIFGAFGKVHKGKPVFPQFKTGNYIYPVKPEKGTVFRGWDFGYNRPSVIWAQFINGQMRVIGEMKGKKIYLDDFITEKVLPYQAEIFSKMDCTFKDFCDPRGSDESDKGSTSVEILNDHGIYPLYRRTRIKEGIQAIKELLTTKNPSGEANFVIHGRCKLLIEGFRGGYHRLDGEEEPSKDKYYEDVFDALRYMAVHLVRRQKFNRAQSKIDDSNVYINPRTGRRVEIQNV